MNKEEDYNQDDLLIDSEKLNEESKQEFNDEFPNEKLDVDELTHELEKTKESDAELILESMPVEVRERIESHLLRVSEYRYSGPIPHPDLLKKFNDLIPDGADRILRMAEDQSKHRQEIEKSVISAKNRDSKNGVYFAGAIGIIGILGTILLIALDKTVAGLLLGGSTFGSLIGVYLKGTHIGDKDLQEKKKSIKKDQNHKENDNIE